MRKLAPLLKKHKERIHLPGTVAYDELASFYSACDVLVLPSIDRLEAFGIVQVEAMLCQTPVIATNLPGVRVPVQKTDGGSIIALRDAEAIARAATAIIKSKKNVKREKALSLVGSVEEFERAL